MPWYATFLGLFCLSSFGFPGTNSFIGEFLILAGAFEFNKGLALAAIPGAVLAAAYMLRMLQKLLYGTENNPDQSHLKDLSVREIAYLAPFAVFVFWIGLGPQPFIDLIHVSVANLLDQFHSWQQVQGVAQVLLQ
jgi:NADH-quinone oxidoreductase subunit M